jgi:putative hydrolase of the HAD superfamily
MSDPDEIATRRSAPGRSTEAGGRPGSNPIDVVFFDAGETILHPYPSFPELFAQVVNAQGYEVSARESTEVQNRLAPHLVDLAADTGVEYPSLSPDASRRFWSYLYRRLLAEFGIEDEALVERLYATFSDTSSYRLFDDVFPALAELEETGHRLGLISNFEGWLEEMLVELEVGHLFDVRVISGLEGVEKPDPLIYEVALERARVEPSAAVHVGDSPSLDVEPASAVGMHVVLVDRKNRYPDAPGPRVGSLRELPAIVETL